jgi:hypothetical protein
MEQQASIISDYWLINKYDIVEYEKLSNYKEYDKFGVDVKKDLLMNYESMLRMHIRYIR